MFMYDECEPSKHFFKIAKEGVNYCGQRTLFVVCRRCGATKEISLDKR